MKNVRTSIGSEHWYLIKRECFLSIEDDYHEPTKAQQLHKLHTLLHHMG